MSEMKKSSIGGQALIEGIMMRGPFKTSMSCRLADGSIDTEVWDTYPNGKKPAYAKIPFVRGIFNMIDTMILGFNCLMKSADKAGVEEDKPSKFEEWISKKFGANLSKVMSVSALVLGLGLAIFLFIVLPTAIAGLLRPWIKSTAVITLIEGIIKILIFLAYLYICTLNKDVARVFEYHGAEHKTIFCYEAGLELTPENAQKFRRFHPRCGTSFIIIVLLVSIVAMSFIPVSNPLLRMVVKLLLLPVIVGVAYEFIKLAGRYDNIFTRIFSAPGLWMQRLTTKEPDLSQLECAIAAMKEVIPEDLNDDQW